MYRRTLAAALLALAAACGSDSVAPETRALTAADAAELAPLFAELAGSLFAVPAGTPGMEVMTGTLPLQLTRPCPGGGSTTVSGSVQLSVDAAARSGSYTLAATASPSACAFPRKTGGTFAVTGNPGIAVTAAQSFAGGVPGVRTATQKGGFTWATEGASGNCALDLASSFDPGNGTNTVRGTFCGFPVDVTR